MGKLVAALALTIVPFAVNATSISQGYRPLGRSGDFTVVSIEKAKIDCDDQDAPIILDDCSIVVSPGTSERIQLFIPKPLCDVSVGDRVHVKFTQTFCGIKFGTQCGGNFKLSKKSLDSNQRACLSGHSYLVELPKELKVLKPAKKSVELKRPYIPPTKTYRLLKVEKPRAQCGTPQETNRSTETVEIDRCRLYLEAKDGSQTTAIGNVEHCGLAAGQMYSIKMRKTICDFGIKIDCSKPATEILKGMPNHEASCAFGINEGRGIESIEPVREK